MENNNNEEIDNGMLINSKDELVMDDSNMENNDKAKNTNRASFVLLGLSIFNTVHSAYIINYKPKIGAHHIWLCSAFGVVLVLFSVWAIIYCVGLLIKKEGKIVRLINA